jgi:small-conductance mechanosensitive channel
MNELQELWLDLQSPAIALELAGLAVSLVVAWLISWALGRRFTSPDSILFGRRLIDGVLFPAVALVFTFGAKLLLTKVQHMPVPVLKVVLPVLVSLVLIRLIARVLAAVFPISRGARLLEQGVSWGAWGLAVLWITGLSGPILDELDGLQFMLGKTRISVSHVLEVVFTSSFVLVLALWLSTTLEQRVLNRAFDDLSMRKVAANALRVLLLVMGTLFALSSLGFDLTALSVIGGALGVGIGDFVRVDGFEGRVTDIKTRYTLVRASNGSESVVPNELLLTQRVENLSLESRHLLQTCTFWVGLESDVERVQALLIQAALSVEWVLAAPAPQALLSEVAPQGLRFNLNFWMEDPVNGQSLTRSRVNIAALSALRAAGVVMVHSPQEVVLRYPT